MNFSKTFTKLILTTLAFTSISFHAQAAGPIGPVSVYVYDPILGPNWQDVVNYKGTQGISLSLFNQRVKSVGLLRFNDNFGTIKPNNLAGSERCSGTLIANNLFLTAAHCLVAPDNSPWPKDTNNLPLNPFKTAPLMHVRFNYQLGLNGAIQPTTDFAVKSVLEFNISDIDYTILQLNGNPGATYGVTPIAQQLPALNQALLMIHHPDGLVKKVSFGKSSGLQIVDATTDTQRLVYANLDTSYGSSGAGVLNLQGQLVAVHSGGEFVNGKPRNYGVSIAQIVADPDAETIRNLLVKVPTGGKIYEFNDPIIGNTPGCTLKQTYGAGGGNTVYYQYSLTCPGHQLQVEKTQTDQNCVFKATPSTYRVSGSCSNWRVYF